MLRRTKEAVAAELPPKQEQVVEVVLHPRHQQIYQTHLQRERQKVLGLIDDLDRNRFTIFRSLTLLRQLSLDAALVDAASTPAFRSAKVDVLLERLDRAGRRGAPGAGVQPVHELPRPDPRTGSTRPGSPTPTSTGATRNRDEVVERFRDGDRAGVPDQPQGGRLRPEPDRGRLLLRARPVVEPGRARRRPSTGPTGSARRKTVMVYRLVAKDTIEEKVMALKARKSELFGSIFDRNDLASASLTAEEIRDLIGA